MAMRSGGIARGAHRGGFQLVELIVVLAVMPVLLLALTHIFGVFAQDMPRNHRVVQERETLLHLMDTLRRDMATCHHAAVDDETGELRLRRDGGTLRYQAGAGRVARRAESGRLPERVWPLPGIVLHWRLRRLNPDLQAVVVESHLEERRTGRVRRRLGETRLLFLAAETPREDQP